MDPVAMALIAAVASGAGGGATDVAKKAMVDSYEGLKALLKKKFGSASKVAEAVETLERRPEATWPRQAVVEELASANAAADPQLLAAAKSLLAHIESNPLGKITIQATMGSCNASVQGSGTASVSISRMPNEHDG